MKKLLLITVSLLLALSAQAQVYDQFGGAIGWSCPANAKAQSYTVSSVGRASGTATVVVTAATTLLQVGEWFTLSGSTPDGGSFNSPANQVWTVATVSGSTITFADAGNALSTSSTSGTLAEAFWYISKIGNRWIECDPVGNGRWHTGLYNINPTGGGGNYQNIISGKFAGDYNKWGANEAVPRLLAWGFNSQLYASDQSAPWNPDMPVAEDMAVTGTATLGFQTTRNRQKYTVQTLSPNTMKDLLRAEDFVNGFTAFAGSGSQDPFDPNFVIYIDGLFAAIANPTNATQTELLNPWSQYIVTDDRDYEYGMGPGLDIATPESTPAPHFGWLALAATPNLYASVVFQQSFFNDPEDYAKQEFVNWLQGKGVAAETVADSGSCNAAGTAATLTVAENPFNVGDTIWVYGIAPGDLAVAQTAPVAVSALTATTIAYPVTCAANETVTAPAAVVSTGVKPLSVSRTSNTVTLTFTANPFKAGNANVDGDLITVTGMLPSDLNVSGAKVLTSTATSLTYAQTGVNESATTIGLVSTGIGYATISAVNTAWGSNYTAFASTSVSHTMTCGTGNGTNTQFSCTLSPLPDPLSVVVKVGSSIVAGAVATTWVPSLLWGPTVAGPSQGSSQCYYESTNCGTLNYSTGALSIWFTTAPGNGVAVTVTYTTSGYGSGTGLEDENGRDTTWLGSHQGDLDTASAGVKTDLDHFLFHYSNLLFRAEALASLRYARRGMLTIGVDSLDGHNGVTRKESLYANALYFDVVNLEMQGYGGITLAGAGDPIVSDSCSANVATINLKSPPIQSPQMLAAGVPVNVSGSANDAGAFNTPNPKLPWKIATATGSSFTFSQDMNGNALTCAALATTADAGLVNVDARQAILNDDYQAIGDRPILEGPFAVANPDTQYYTTAITSELSGGEYWADTQENRGAQVVSLINWLLTAQPYGDASYPIIGYDLDGYYDFSSTNWGLVDNYDNPYDGRSAGPLDGTDVYGNPTGCFGQYGCSPGRVSAINYSSGYMTLWFAPGQAPASGAALTVNYTIGTTNYPGESLGTGDGVTRGFSHQMANSGTVVAGSVSVLVNSTTVATDNSNGTFTGATVDGPEAAGNVVRYFAAANQAWKDQLLTHPVRSLGALGGVVH